MDFLSIDPATADTNLIYITFIVSLWIGVTAAYIPGTGIVEGVGVVALIGSVLILSEMPTNWLFALLIVAGVSFFIVIPFIQQKHAPLALAGLASQGVGGLFLFREGLSPSPFIIAVSLVIPLAYYQWVLVPILNKAHQSPAITKDDKLIGAKGVVTKTVDPIGTVRVNSELWTAKSLNKITLEVGDDIVVIDKQGLHLIVESLNISGKEK